MSKVLKANFIDLKDSARVLNYILEPVKILNDTTEEIELEETHVIKRVSLEDHTKQADLIVEHAQLEAKQIIEEAQQEIENEKELVYKNTYEEAYEAGFRAGEEKASEIIYQAEQMKQAMKLEKEKLTSEIQGEVANIVMSLVTKLVGKAQLNPNLIIHLIKLGFNEVEAIDQMVIHVCPEDYEHVLKNMDKIYEFMDQKTKVEFFRNTALSRGSCIIETPYGSIESSLGIQLKNLLSDLELIKESFNQ